MAHRKSQSFLSIVFEYIRVILGALVLAAVVRSLWFEPFKIPSTSMVPTLLVGDYLFVDKNNYGWRNPCTGERYNGEDPKRGDVVVFEREKGYFCGLALGLGSLNFIKRIVAVEGDTIAYRNKTLYVNGEPAHITYKDEYEYEDANSEKVTVKRYDSNFYGAEHHVLIDDGRSGLDVPESVVPAGHYVMVGDNRDNSVDSRYWVYPDWGFVKKEEIVGQAKRIFWSWDNGLKPRFERLGHEIK